MSTTGENSQYVLKFAGAAISNMAASAATNPLDIIKVRQQLRTQTPGVRSNAFWTVGVEMARTEGVLSLMKGFSASMLRELVYSGMRLGSYEYFKDVLHERSQGSLSREGIGLKVAAATIASALGSAIANPTDLVKVRMQAYYPSGSPYRNMRHAFAMIWKEGVAPAASTGPGSVPDGLRALYRGTTPTTVRGIVLSVSQICSYDQAKQVLKRRGLIQEGVGLHFVASMFAGLVCSITSNPVDVVKVRLMNDSGREYRGVSDCVRNIMAEEGPLAFYKGFGMCWARLGLHTVLTFVVFERLRLLFGVGAL